MAGKTMPDLHLSQTPCWQTSGLADAPMHQPHNLAAIRCVIASRPDLPQVACFDTSYHQTQNRLSQLPCRATL
jgi:hypothetical protein